MYNMCINSKLGTTKIAGKTYIDYETLHTSLSRKVHSSSSLLLLLLHE